MVSLFVKPNILFDMYHALLYLWASVSKYCPMPTIGSILDMRHKNFLSG